MTNMYIMPKWQREAVAIIRNNGFISLKQVEFLQNEDEVFSFGKYTQKESILRAFCRNAGLVQVGKYLFNAYEAEEYGKKLEISEWREPSTAVEEALSFILQIAKHVKDKQGARQLDLSGLYRYGLNFFDFCYVVIPDTTTAYAKKVKTEDGGFEYQIVEKEDSEVSKISTSRIMDVLYIGEYKEGDFHKYAAKLYYKQMQENDAKKVHEHFLETKEMLDRTAPDEKHDNFIIVDSVLAAAYFYIDFYNKTKYEYKEIPLTFFQKVLGKDFEYVQIPQQEIVAKIKQILEIRATEG